MRYATGIVLVLEINCRDYHGRGTKGMLGDQRNVIVFLKTMINQEMKIGELKHSWSCQIHSSVPSK